DDEVEEDEEEEEEEEEDEDEEHDAEGDVDDHQQQQEEEAENPATKDVVTPGTPEVNPCKIVQTLFSSVENLKDACPTKYGKTAPSSWKCIPSGDKTATSGKATGKSGGSGAICVPPRRRKLYLHKIEGVDTTESLRDWFVQSAAVETFFLWDRYKKLKKPRSDGLGSQLGLSTQYNNNLLGTLQGEGDENDKDPQKKLEENGEIPNDFLRQMFYTLGDYRDICIGDDTMIKALEASGDKNIKEISSKIEEILKNGAENPGQTTKPEDWWERNAKHIWHGMLCSLSYNTENRTKNEEVYKKFFGKDGNISMYKYESVPINGGPNNAISLSDFARIPTFFRWLEEWGEEFCRKRTDKLKKLDKECRGVNSSGNEKYCSGDGHDCTDDTRRYNNMFDDLDCRPCYEQCRKYRKWIDIKFEEYHKQEKKYKGEFQKLNGNSNGDGDINCCEEIKKKATAAEFLKELKHCKDDQGGEEKGNELDFTNTKTTFGPLDYCKACPYNIVKCNSGSGRAKNGCKEVNRNGKTWDTVFHTINGNSTDITVEMIDHRAPYIEEYMEKKSQNSNHLFKTSKLFKGLSKQKWKCKVIDNNTDVCKLDEFKENIDLNKYTTFKVFLEYWLQDFIEGYYILKKRKIIEQCTEKEGKACSEESKKNCACVITWIEQKKNEWNDIKNHFNIRKHDDAFNMAFKVQNLFEKNELHLKKWIENYDNLKNTDEYEDCIE
ncbi:hypothetical protein PFTANZ_06476, partial [Plasmodium falciparum Tanzania (2000708)]